MKSLLILGAGGHGKVVADTAEAAGIWKEIAFLDDRFPQSDSGSNWPVIGSIQNAREFLSRFNEFVVAIGDNVLRVQLLKEYLKLDHQSPVIIHPQSYVSPASTLGPGCVVFAHGVVNTGARIGLGGIVNTGATVDHDCILAEGVHLCPGVHLAGDVQIGKMTTLGIGSSVIQQIAIGNHVMLGAGSVVTQNIEDQATAAGVPAKIIKNHE